MQVGKAIYSLISAVEANVYPVSIPQGVKGNKVVYNIISNVPTNIKNRVSAVDQYRVQISCYTNKYNTVCTLAQSIRTALDNYSGTVAGVLIDRIRFENQMDTYDLQSDQYGIMTDYIIKIK